jgi:hypothetical protein
MSINIFGLVTSGYVCKRIKDKQRHTHTHTHTHTQYSSSYALRAILHFAFCILHFAFPQGSIPASYIKFSRLARVSGFYFGVNGQRCCPLTFFVAPPLKPAPVGAGALRRRAALFPLPFLATRQLYLLRIAFTPHIIPNGCTPLAQPPSCRICN